MGGTLNVDSAFAGQYNGRGTRYLENNQGLTPSTRFDFATAVNGFAFNSGASDVTSTMSAFNAANVLLETFTTPITSSSNAGDYIGLIDNGIKYVTLTTSNVASADYLFIDNFVTAGATAAVVPEPDSIALLGLGVAAVALLRRRKSAR